MTADDTNGNAGTNGSGSRFGSASFCTAAGGTGGGGGTTTSATGGTTSGGTFAGGAGGASSSTGGAGTGGTTLRKRPAVPLAAVALRPVTRPATVRPVVVWPRLMVAAGQLVPRVQAVAPEPLGLRAPGSEAAGVAEAEPQLLLPQVLAGPGGIYGGGGGGGGASLNGNDSGAGGDGAIGIVIVTSW